MWSCFLALREGDLHLGRHAFRSVPSLDMLQVQVQGMPEPHNPLSTHLSLAVKNHPGTQHHSEIIPAPLPGCLFWKFMSQYFPVFSYMQCRRNSRAKLAQKGEGCYLRQLSPFMSWAAESKPRGSIREARWAVGRVDEPALGRSQTAGST